MIDCEKWCCRMLLCRPYTCSHLFIGDLKRAFYFLFSTMFVFLHLEMRIPLTFLALMSNWVVWILFAGTWYAQRGTGCAQSTECWTDLVEELQKANKQMRGRGITCGHCLLDLGSAFRAGCFSLTWNQFCHVLSSAQTTGYTLADPSPTETALFYIVYKQEQVDLSSFQNYFPSFSFMLLSLHQYIFNCFL